MGTGRPPELAVLLDSPDPAARERAWAGFLARYTPLLQKAAGVFGGDYDARMDRYQHLVGALAQDDYRRLRAYHAQARSSFLAWLTVVARRLCVDHDRARHGRGGRAETNREAAEAVRRARRQLAALAGADLDPDSLVGDQAGPEAHLEVLERQTAVEQVLAQLAPRDRLLIRLRFDDDLPIRQIADMMGFPTVFHVYRRLRVVLDDLRTRLEQAGVNNV